MAAPVCVNFWYCLKEFQPLVAGTLAIAGALGTATVVYISARLPVKAAEKRLREEAQQRVRLRKLELSEELGTLAKRARMAASTVKVHKAANKDVTDQTRRRMLLETPSALSDWQFMSLIAEEAAVQALQLAARIRDHNFDVERAGGPFGADNFGASIIERLYEIESGATALRGALANH